jgi:hypothetical protein
VFQRVTTYALPDSMPPINLTARFIESLKGDPSTKQRDYWDESITGLGLRVSSGGRKTWVVMYRHNRRQRRLTLGTFPVLTLADARARAREALALVAAGKDPGAEKVAARRAKKFAELAAEYLERHAKPHKKTWKEDERNLRVDVLPRWQHVRPVDITRTDVRSLVDAIVDRNAKVHANRVLALVRKVFNFGIQRDWLEHQSLPPRRTSDSRDFATKSPRYRGTSTCLASV